MPVKVVDASALASLVLREPERTAVLREMEGCDLVAPDLLPYELANAAWKAARRRPELAAKLRESLETTLRVPLRYVPVPAAGACRLALEVGTTAYDAAYLWLVHELDVEVITRDDRMATLARQVRRSRRGE